jgi:hypothetical protein
MRPSSSGARELTIAFFVYVLIAIGLSWPLIWNFSTRLLGDVAYDQRHSVWLLWHYKEALLGRQPWFTADLLVYPTGISTLIDGVGPVSAFLALPFWPLGPIAAYNGALLLGLALSGWCMYLLVRVGGESDANLGLAGLDRACAFFAGVAFMVWPIHLVGLYGHIEKVFVGLLPLSVLAVLFAIDPARPRHWLAAPGIVLLLAALQNGNQFMFALIATVIVGIARLVTSGREAWRPVLLRAVIAGALSFAIAGPLLLTIARILDDPAIQTAASLVSTHYSPDLAQLVVPSIHQATVGRLFYPHYEQIGFDFTRESRVPWLNPELHWQGSGIETAVTIPLTVLLLVIVSWIARRRGTIAWTTFSAIFVVCALGPFLRMGGRTTFTVFQLPVVLPFAVLASKQGFTVMRTPGRFMMIASLGLALLGAFGLARLRQAAPRHARLIAIAATMVLLVEMWPRAWPQQVPLPVPEFYTKIAADAESYAVLDLPSSRWRPDYGSAYMYYQVVHRKPIAWSYLSRQYDRYPIAGLRGILDDNPMDDAGIARTRARLIKLGYRYVVWHKRSDELFGSRRPSEVHDGQWRNPPADAQTNPFVRQAFAGEQPIVDDDLVTVYRLDRPTATQ